MSNWFSGHSGTAKRTLVTVLPLFLVACAFAGQPAQDEQEMQSLGAALTKLSSAVDVTVAYENLPAEITEQQLLVHSTQHDPSLLKRFDGYNVRALVQDQYLVLLVCTEDRRRALLEDAACTPGLDRHAWRDEDAACEFSLRDVAICPAP